MQKLSKVNYVNSKTESVGHIFVENNYMHFIILYINGTILAISIVNMYLFYFIWWFQSWEREREREREVYYALFQILNSFFLNGRSWIVMYVLSYHLIIGNFSYRYCILFGMFKNVLFFSQLEWVVFDMYRMKEKFLGTLHFVAARNWIVMYVLSYHLIIGNFSYRYCILFGMFKNVLFFSQLEWVVFDMYRMKEKFLGTLHFVAARKLDIQKLKYWFIVAQASYFRIKLMLDSFSKYQIVETSLTEMLMCLCDCLYFY
jgi:hypothetical protein